MQKTDESAKLQILTIILADNPVQNFQLEFLTGLYKNSTPQNKLRHADAVQKILLACIANTNDQLSLEAVNQSFLLKTHLHKYWPIISQHIERRWPTLKTNLVRNQHGGK